MSETTSNGGKIDDEDLEETYADEDAAQYTVDLNGKRYRLNGDVRERIQTRAKLAFDGNEYVSVWWRVATAEDEQDDDTVHEAGDPLLVIETEGRMVPWSKLDQLELEMQDESAFDGVDDGSGGMRMVDADADGDDGGEEKNRTHFGVTPQNFEEVPSPDGEDPDRVPAKPREFDEPSMVMFIPDNPDLEHTWETGEAITSVTSWVEWNVQQKANQPRLDEEAADSHEHWESILAIDDCDVVGELAPSQDPKPDDSDDDVSGSVERKGEDRFTNGTANGDNWNV